MKTLRGSCVVLAVTLLVLQPATAEVSIDVRFETPAQNYGNVAPEGSHWALLLFHPGSAAFDFDLAAGIETNSTIYRIGQDGSRTGHESAGVPVPDKSRSLDGESRGSLQFVPGSWASLVLEADAISIESIGAVSITTGSRAGEAYTDKLPPLKYPVNAVYPGPGLPPPWLTIAEDGVAVNGVSPHEPFLSTRLVAAGIHRISWHNATTACTTETCPQSSQGWTMMQASAGERTSMQRLSYIAMAPSTGTMRGYGQVAAWATGGPSLGMAIDGGIRLPATTLGGDCPENSCPDASGRTFLANGSMRFSALSWDSDGPNRLRGQLTGRFNSAAFDESPIPAFTAEQGAMAVLAMAGLAFGLKAVIGLFARSSRLPALENPRRRELHRLILAEPGLSFRAIQRRLGWSIGTLKFHMDRLLDEGIVKAEAYRNTVRYFENHGKYAKTWRELAPMRDPEVQRLHAWLLEHPALNQTRIVEATHEWGWTRAKLRRRLDSLLEAGLVDGRRNGRRTEYDAKPYRA